MLLAGTITWYPNYVTAIIVVLAAIGLMAVDREWRSRLLVDSTSAFGVALAAVSPDRMRYDR